MAHCLFSLSSTSNTRTFNQTHPFVLSLKTQKANNWHINKSLNIKQTYSSKALSQVPKQDANYSATGYDY